MRRITELLSLLSIVAVFAVVLFASVCPQMSVAHSASNTHKSCTDTSMTHTEISNKVDGCFGIQMDPSGYLLGIIPTNTDVLFILAAAFVLLYAVQKFRQLLLDLVRPIFTRLRYIFFEFKVFIEPKIKSKLNIWSNIVVHPVNAIA